MRKSLIVNFIEHHILFIIGIFLLNIYEFSDDSLSEGWHHSLRLLFEIIVLSILISSIPVKSIKAFSKMIIVVISGIMFFINTVVYCLYSTKFNIGILEILAATNSREASEYIKEYISVGICFEICASVLVVLALIFMAKKISIEILRIKYMKNILVVMLLWSLGSGIDGCIRHSEYMLYECNSIGKMYYMINTAIENMRISDIIQSEMDKNNIVMKKNKSEIPLVVFILGESTNRNHMSIYGYDLPTTPNLRALQRDNQLHVFTDVISPHSHTIQVLQKLFTFYHYGDTDGWYKYNNLFDILQETKYTTSWISNQESTGIYGNVGQAYSKRCDKCKFIKLHESQEHVQSYDEEILPYLAQELYGDEYKFLVVHMMGTHSGYWRRYPDKWSKFSAEDERVGDSYAQKQTIAEYDNAILYNDYVINEIIKSVLNKDAMVIYVSDHSEELYQERDYAGHDEINGTVNMIEVPMFIFTTQEFKKNHPDKEKKIMAAINRPYMTDDMLHTILDLLDIETLEFQPTRSIISDDFDITRERIYTDRLYIKDDNGSRLVTR